jgi:hypothetical protein
LNFCSDLEKKNCSDLEKQEKKALMGRPIWRSLRATLASAPEKTEVRSAPYRLRFLHLPLSPLAVQSHTIATSTTVNCFSSSGFTDLGHGQARSQNYPEAPIMSIYFFK